MPAPRRRFLIAIIGVAAVAALAVTLLLMLLRGGPPGTEDRAPDAGRAVPVHVEPVADAAPEDAAGRAAPPARDAKPTRPRPTRRITDQELRALQRQHHGLIKYCFDRTAARAPAMVGARSSVRVELAAGGRVKSVQVDAGTDAELAACLRRMIRGWRFSATLKAQQVSFPIVVAR